MFIMLHDWLLVRTDILLFQHILDAIFHYKGDHTET